MPTEVEQALRWFAQPIPGELWEALRDAP